MSVRALYDVPAPAKLNLFLHVVGRRADGYHLLQSPFVLVDWTDVLHFERRDDGQLARHDLSAVLPEDDLCLRAARALQAASGSPFGADLIIDKRVPWGAGLGGGSSDAASTLLALNRLWQLNWPLERLSAIAVRLGADVPFFLGGENAFVEGIGERLTPLQVAPAWYAVVKPPCAIATQSIFSDPELERDSEAVILTGSLVDASGRPVGQGNAAVGTGVRQRGQGGEDIVGGFGRNDLQPVAERKFPEVAQVGAWLASRFGNSRMTGSGSAVFARAGAGDLPVATLPVESLPPGWVGRMCRSLDQHPLKGWAG